MRIWGPAVLLAAAACQQQPSAPPKPAEISFEGAEVTDAAALQAHGDRLTWVLGCKGCHGQQLQGHRFYERYAVNLTRKMPELSDAEFQQILRTGTHDGEEIWGMPSEIFQHLSSSDLSALIAYLRTLKPAGPADGKPLPWEPDALEMIRKGELKPAADFVRETKAIGPVDLGPSHALGRYITRVTCAECHGPKLEGQAGGPPNLIVAGGYTRAEFETLMTKGIPSGGRKFKDPLMGEVARERFAHLTPRERDALYAYLKARAEQPQ